MLVEGTEFDAHDVGLCDAPRTARVTGEIKGDKFIASAFEFADDKGQEAHAH